MISERAALLASDNEVLVISMPRGARLMTAVGAIQIDRDCMVSLFYEDGTKESAGCRDLLSEMPEDDIQLFRIVSRVQSHRKGGAE